MRVLLDTNVVLDFLLQRDGFFDDASKIMQMIVDKRFDAYLCATSMTTIDYFLKKHIGKKESLGSIGVLLEYFQIASVDKNVLTQALEKCGADYEDSVIYTSAKEAKLDFIITRDKKGFERSKVKVLSPKEFLRIL